MLSIPYEYKTEPLKHQREELEANGDKRFHALFCEMGTGKSKIIIDNSAYLFLKKEINGVFVIAPNGVDLNWLLDQIPEHLPESVAEQSRMFRFSTSKKAQRWHKEEIRWNREHKGLAWLFMSYDAFMTNEGKEAGLKFLEERECLYVLDESVNIKTPGAKRTMRITRTAHRAKYRRILDGYPTTKGAFDLYTQIKFLDEDFWKQQGWDSAAAFRSYFGVYEDERINPKTGRVEKLYNHKTNTHYTILSGYQNLDELHNLIAPISTRVLKKDVLDLPPKIYQPRYFELSKEQREIYDSLEEEYRIWLDQQTLVTANLAIVRMLRLQQISCGYLPVGEGEPVHIIPGKNPRLQLLEHIISAIEEKTIIWARYKLDIKLIEELVKSLGFSYALYTGDTKDEDRIKAKEGFQKGNIQFFIATPDAAGVGHTLHAAHYMIYYSNSMNLRYRKQSEDRVHRVGLDHPINIIDLLGENTMDKKIMLNLCGKMDTADVVLGDEEGNDVRNQLLKWFSKED